MRIIVDAFGGDNAPEQILLGCAQARQELGVDILLTGDKARLEACAKELNLQQELAAMEILPCGQTLTMEDEPTSVIREKSDSSMAVGLRALAEGKGDAFASAGNSGALVVGATTIVKRVRGVKRVAFAPIMPKSQGFFILMFFLNLKPQNNVLPYRAPLKQMVSLKHISNSSVIFFDFFAFQKNLPARGLKQSCGQ